MLCYKDRSYCIRTNKCANMACDRRTDVESFQPGDMPVAYSTFDSCNMYVRVGEDNKSDGKVV